jgi:excisionase family DNA binding protein
MSSTERPTLSVAETADLLGISRWLVQQAAHDGSLPSVRVGRRILIRRSRLLAWLDGQHDPRAPGPGPRAGHVPHRRPGADCPGAPCPHAS